MNRFPMMREFCSDRMLMRTVNEDTVGVAQPIFELVRDMMLDDYITYWDGSTIWEQMIRPRGGDDIYGFHRVDYDKMNIWNVPSRPPSEAAWIEYAVIDGHIGVLAVKDHNHSTTWLTFTKSTGEQGVFLSPVMITTTYEDDGVIVSHEQNGVKEPLYRKQLPGWEPETDSHEDQYWTATTDTGFLVGTLLFAFSHCKNIDTVIRHPQRQELRSAKRENRKIVTAWNEIIIDPAAPRVQGDGKTPFRKPTAGVTPLHLVRGHFAHYTEDRPLFGKYTGSFWHPAHARGRADLGERKHIYSIKQKREGSQGD